MSAYDMIDELEDIMAWAPQREREERSAKGDPSHREQGDVAARSAWRELRRALRERNPVALEAAKREARIVLGYVQPAIPTGYYCSTCGAEYAFREREMRPVEEPVALVCECGVYEGEAIVDLAIARRHL